MVPVLVDVAGHIGYAFLALGMLLLARKSIWGWVFRWVGEIVWLAIGIVIDMSSIWTWGLLFLGIEAYGFRSWQKREK